MKLSWKALIAFAGVFIAGALAGGALTLHWYKRRPAPLAPKLTIEQFSQNQLNSMAERLKLSDEQRELLKPAFARAKEELRQIRRYSFRQTIDTMERLNSELSKVLTPEQVDAFEDLRFYQRERLRSFMQGTQPPPRKDSAKPQKKEGEKPVPQPAPAEKATPQPPAPSK